MNRSIIETQRKCLNDYQNRIQQVDSTETASFPKKVKKKNSTKKKIVQLLDKNNYESAFTTVLSEQNLELVSWIISTVDPDIIFSQKPPALSQHVLISLIQQLGYDLSTNIQKNWIGCNILLLN